MKKAIKITDTQRLNLLEKRADGCALLSDDNGHWTVACDGFQNCGFGKEPIDIETTFFVEKERWHKNIREAIDNTILEMGGI